MKNQRNIFAVEILRIIAPALISSKENKNYLKKCKIIISRFHAHIHQRPCKRRQHVHVSSQKIKQATNKTPSSVKHASKSITKRTAINSL